MIGAGEVQLGYASQRARGLARDSARSGGEGQIKVSAKLGLSSRGQLRQVMPTEKPPLLTTCIAE